jgi:hypothetical protein
MSGIRASDRESQETPSPGLTALLLREGRRRSRLTLHAAAAEVGVAPDELREMEEGVRLPDDSLVERLGVLYPMDSRLLLQARGLERNYPQLAGRVTAMETTALSLARWFSEHPKAVQGDERMAAIADSLGDLSALCLHASQGAERHADYFSIGHLSDTLLKALQDPEFHARIEDEARKHLGSPARRQESGSRQPDGRDDNSSTLRRQKA